MYCAIRVLIFAFSETQSSTARINGLVVAVTVRIINNRRNASENSQILSDSQSVPIVLLVR